MSKTKINNSWVLTRQNNTPDTERQIQRDDPLFNSLELLFTGQKTQLDLEFIAFANGLKPEDVFIDLHENYGYICIGTGENPAAGEKLNDTEKKARQYAIEQTLEKHKIPHILIRGKYMGMDEYSYFIPFFDNTIGLSTVLQSDMVQKISEIATFHKQDSLLICQKGHSCYLYTTGPQTGTVITGNSAVVYADKKDLPEDCYSLFLLPNQEVTVAFTCGLNFDRIYSNIEEFILEQNQNVKKEYQDFTTTVLSSDSTPSNTPKVVVILRGADGYNQYAVNLKRKLNDLSINAAIVGTDANIAQINLEVEQDSRINGPKANWKWPEVRTEFVKRNKEIFDYLLSRPGIDVVIYTEMNVFPEYLVPYFEAVTKNGNSAIANVVNSFVLEPNRTEYIENLCNKYGNFMGRHIANFKKTASQIYSNILIVNDLNVRQLHSASEENLSNEIRNMLRNTRSIASLSNPFSHAFFNQKNNGESQYFDKTTPVQNGFKM